MVSQPARGAGVERVDLAPSCDIFRNFYFEIGHCCDWIFTMSLKQNAGLHLIAINIELSSLFCIHGFLQVLCFLVECIFSYNWIFVSFLMGSELKEKNVAVFHWNSRRRLSQSKI